jgi:ABC-type glycerol-3-phosphate transport system permease component
MSTLTRTATPTTEAEFVASARRSKLTNILTQTLKYVILLALSFTYFFPLYWMMSSALKNDPQVYTIPPVLIPNPAFWNNFMDAWTKYGFTSYLINTIFRYTLPVTLLTVISSSFVAYGFSRLRWPGRNILFYLCMGTMMLPWQVTMVPLFIVYRTFGWYPSYLPLVVPSLFGSAYFIFMLRQFFMSIPEELSEAARIEGASEFTIFFRMILPLSVPALSVVALFRFLGAWNDYLGPLIYLNDPKLFPLALGIDKLRTIATSVGTSNMAYPHLMAVSTMVALPIIILFFFAQRTFIEGISLTGLKG